MYFQDIILNLKKFWREEGCNIFESFNDEIGAGTFHPFTMLKPYCFNIWNVAYTQVCIRPNDGKYANNFNKSQHYYQFQVLLKPSTDYIKYQCLRSIKILGMSNNLYDLKFIDSDWSNPTLGACGIGWEILCNGMEIIQFTYMQRIGGIECAIIPGEITYGLERISMYLQEKNNIWNLVWGYNFLTYKELFLFQEKEFCIFYYYFSNTNFLIESFVQYELQFKYSISKKTFYPAYSFCLKACNIFNSLQAKKVLSSRERYFYISRLRKIVKICCDNYIQNFSYIK